MFDTATAIDALGIDYLGLPLLHFDSLHRAGSKTGVTALTSLIYRLYNTHRHKIL